MDIFVFELSNSANKFIFAEFYYPMIDPILYGYLTEYAEHFTNVQTNKVIDYLNQKFSSLKTYSYINRYEENFWNNYYTQKKFGHTGTYTKYAKIFNAQYLMSSFSKEEFLKENNLIDTSTYKKELVKMAIANRDLAIAKTELYLTKNFDELNRKEKQRYFPNFTQKFINEAYSEFCKNNKKYYQEYFEIENYHLIDPCKTAYLLKNTKMIDLIREYFDFSKIADFLYGPSYLRNTELDKYVDSFKKAGTIKNLLIQKYIKYNYYNQTDSDTDDDSDSEEVQNINKFDKIFRIKYIFFSLCQKLQHYYINPKEAPEYNLACQNFSFEDFLLEKYNKIELHFNPVQTSGNCSQIDKFTTYEEVCSIL